MQIRLYGFGMSHPVQAARLMLERKGLPYERVDLLPGMHPVQLRLHRFRGGTVPALRIDGRKVQGTLAISRALEELAPEPRLFPVDLSERRAVEEAEAWGESELQPLPRRLFRWALSRHRDARRYIAGEVMRLPLPALAAEANRPVVWALARQVGASDEQVRADLEGLPAKLDRVDQLIGERVIGGEQPNAADFQIGTSVRVLESFADLEPLLDGRPARELGRRILPKYATSVAGVVPPEWMPRPAARG